MKYMSSPTEVHRGCNKTLWVALEVHKFLSSRASHHFPASSTLQGLRRRRLRQTSHRLTDRGLDIDVTEAAAKL
jgi:hypothetical protein